MTEGHWFVRIVLVRHGQARSNDGMYGPDTPLSALGRRQANVVAGALAREPPGAAVYSSPLPRALQTAGPIAVALHRPVTEDARLSELQVEAAPLNLIAAGRSDIAIWRPEHRGAKNGETVAQFFGRVEGFCNWICDTHRDQRIVLVTHAGTIDAVFRWALGILPHQPWTFELEVPNGSISEVEVWPKGRNESGPPRHTVLYRVGDASHLSEHSSPI